MLDPVLLESFLAVAQARNFSEAGRRLGLRQSTISQHIRKLEDDGGTAAVRARHPLRGADRRWRGDGGLCPLHPGGQRAGPALFRRLAAARTGAVRRVGGFRDLPPAGGAGRFRPAAPAGRSGADRRSERHAVPDAGCRRARSRAVQAARRRRTGTAGLARPAGLDRHRGDADRPGAAAAADPLYAAEHHPRPWRWRRWSAPAGRGGSSAPAAA